MASGLSLITGSDAAAFTEAVNTVAANLGIDPNILTILMHFESGLSASRKNPNSSATGLIQFLSSTAQGLGTTTAALGAMTRVNQMSYVQKYFQQQFQQYGQQTDFVDLYLLINYPAGVTVTNPCTPLPYTPTALANNSILANSSGWITKASILTCFYNRYLKFGIDITQYEAIPNCSGTNYGSGPTTTSATTNKTASNINTPPTINSAFGAITTNINNTELETTSVSWGSRTNPAEASDFIGLKQFLLYLTTRFYPQNLIPFVELIPIFSIDTTQSNPSVSSNINSQQATANPSTFAANNQVPGYDYKTAQSNNLNSIPGGNTLLEQNRFNKTASNLNDLSSTGGTDIFNIDPFFEYTSSLNTPNAAGQQIITDRGYGFKIFGAIDVTPPIEGGTTSKAGGIGLRSIEIDAGSQVQNGMTLITMKFLDVQGNKFLDINSPWSFILNSRPGGIGADFYFRFGWQVKVPDPKTKDDAQAKRYWNHPGWLLFSSLNGEGGDVGDDGKVIKTYIQSIAQQNDNFITLTQATTLSSMNTPGYSRDQTTGTFLLDRKLNPLDYMGLVLVNPELNVNPVDGSIEATLQFRSTYAVANCLCLLNGSNIPYNSSGVQSFETKALVVSNNAPTLSDLMQAFIDDNRSFILNNPSLKNINNNKTSSLFLADHDINDWLTVIGGAGTDSTISVDPSSIIVNINDDLLGQIKRPDDKNTTTLISWLNAVLQANNMALLSAGSVENNVQNISSANNSLNGGFIIAYDSDKAQQNSQTITGTSLALKDPSFGDFLNYTSPSQGNQNFVGNRLFTQDDVFAFRFQGSLVEEFGIEKLEIPNQATIQAQKNLATNLGEDANSTDVKTNPNIDDNGNSSGGNAPTTQNNPPSQNVTSAGKLVQLNILYSTMLGLRVKAICHPWLKIGRPAYVKGMGFWDGKYFITKIKHTLDEGNKFITEVNAMKVNADNSDINNSANAANSTESAMNNPAAKKAQPILNPIKSQPTRSYIIPSTATVSPFATLAPDGSITNAVSQPLLRASLEAFIQNLHYAYQDSFRNLISSFETQNPQYQILITSGYRSWAEQATLYAQNPSNAKPGYSTHNYGIAIDVNITDTSGNVLINKASSNTTWINSGWVQLVKSLGFTWGGTSFGEYRDPVHAGLDDNFDKNVLYSMSILQFGSNPANIQGNKLNLSDASKSFDDTPTPPSNGTNNTSSTLNIPPVNTTNILSTGISTISL
jgi:hypothetical protein